MTGTAQPRRVLTTPTSVAHVVRRYAGANASEHADCLAVEAALEIRLIYSNAGKETALPLSVTMRTPGNDDVLSAGLLYSEGIIQSPQQIVEIVAQDHVVVVRLRDVHPDPAQIARRFQATASCGVCGKVSRAALRIRPPFPPGPRVAIEPSLIYTLSARLRNAQTVFEQTGGLHAAGVFDRSGSLLCAYEDVGRHNALDKVIGECLLAGRLPLRDELILVSGRASFELMQKTIMAGGATLLAVSAPSTLAVTLAQEFDVTLVAFLREQSFNVYHGAERVR